MNKLFLPVVFLPTSGKQTDIEKKLKTKTKNPSFLIIYVTEVIHFISRNS